MASRIHTDFYEMESQKNKKEARKIEEHELHGKLTPYLMFCLCIAAFGAAFQVGWAIGLYNTPLDVIKLFFNKVNFQRTGKPMTTSEFDLLWAITNGLFPLGAAISGFTSGIVADRFGRLKSLLLTNVLVILAGVLNVVAKFANTYEMLMVARFISGLFTGYFTGILPIYLTELPPANLRGLTGTMNQLLIVVGIMMTNIFGLKDVLGTPDLWPVLVGLMIAFSLVHIGLFFAVESPKYLYLKLNDPAKARENLVRLRGPDQLQLVENEMMALENEKIELSQQKNVTWSDLFTVSVLRKALFVALFVHFAQQFSGINAVIFYSTKIFISVGLDGDWPAYGTIILGVVQVIMTFVCLGVIERLGRKLLLTVGMAGMALSSFGLALFRIFGGPDEPVLNYLTVACAVIYIISFSIGPGAIPWILATEMFNSDARGKANSIAVLVNWGSAFIVTVAFPFVEAAIKDYSFFIFGGLGLIFTLFMAFLVPETKSKSYEQIQREFKTRTFFPLGYKAKEEVRF